MDNIEPLSHTFKSITYTCIGEGLLKDGWTYDAHPEKFFPPKTTKAPKNSTIVETPNIEKKPAAWWKAQCAFRRLNQTGAIGDMQLRIKESKAKMLPELKEAETRLNKEYKKLTKAAMDGKWKNVKTAEQKAEKDPKKFLTEVFPKGGTGRPANLDIVVVKIANRAMVADAAEATGLEKEARSGSLAYRWKDKRCRVESDADDREGEFTERQTCFETKAVLKETSASKETAEKTPASKEKATTKEKPAPKGKITAKAAVTPKEKPAAKVKSPPKKKPSIGGSGLIVTCDHCDKVTYEEYYHCFDCGSSNFDLCLNCVQNGIRCHNDEHWWIKRVVRNGVAVNTGEAILSTDAVTLHSRSNEEPPSKKRQVGKGVAATNTKPEPKVRREPKIKPEPKVKPEPKTKDQTKQESSANGGNAWDVRGVYAIKCPEIEDQWDAEDDNDMTLDLHIENRRGKNQMFGIFNFRVVSGIMRFEKPIPVPKSEPDISSSKRKRDNSYDVDEDGDIIMDSLPVYTNDANEPDASYTAKAFYLRPKDKPTIRRPTWSYRWRGQETGECEIQIDADQSVRTISFSNKGNELEGMFDCGFIGDCRLTGIKISEENGDEDDPEGIWEEFNDARFRY